MPTGAISTRTQAKFGRTTIWIPAYVAVTAVALALVSHDPIADGPRRLFAIALVQLLAGSLVFGTVVFRSSLVDATKASFLSLLLVLGGVAIHVARLVHPLSRSVPDVNVTWRAGDVLPPEVEVSSRPPRATPYVQEPSVLSSTGSSGSALQITIPPVPKDWPWWAPVGASRLARSHHLVLVATSVRTAPYFMVINSGRLRIQLTSAGIMITAPDGSGDVSERTMTTPVVTDGTAHRWQLTAEPERTTVSIDGNELWSIPRSAQVDSAFTIGDASGDREHGGSLIVQRLSYQRVPVRTTTT
ncbi:MAG: hypothetical protein KGR25_02930 [Chloroflexi bacterium]|nr:hypothetical protein [Chloroflexota bacterium]